jgi:hypothetical protein
MVLTTTDELIRAYDDDDEFDRRKLEAVIPAAIDALYAVRDAGGNAHEAGAAAGVAALRALRDLGLL